MTDIEVPMVHATQVHAPRCLRHGDQQRALEAQRRWVLRPAQAVVLETDRRRQLLGNDERQLPRRIAAAQTEGDGAHAVHPEVAQALDRQPLVRRPEHGQAQCGEVLGDFGPADAAISAGNQKMTSLNIHANLLDKIRTAGNIAPQNKE